jgi:LPS export ABC transporter protein LptC
MIRLFPVASLILLLSCTKQDAVEPVPYKGPLREVENLESVYTQHDQVKTKVAASLVYELAGGDREFPKGIYVENYDDAGNLKSTLKADYAYFHMKDNLWQGTGHVEVRNILTLEQLNTEELFWKQVEQTIYTDKFLTLLKPGDVLYGTGLDAKQDLSDYVIHNPEGLAEVNE